MRDVDSAAPDSRRLMLQARARTTKFTHPRGFNYVPAAECFGLGCPCPVEDPTSRLLAFLYIEIANQGGCFHWSDCCCRARFVPAAGRWEVLGNRATMAELLLHLPRTPSQRRAASTAAGPSGAIAPTDAHYARGRSRLEDAGRERRSPLRQFNNWVKAFGSAA
eukprot:gene11470-65360_t